MDRDGPYRRRLDDSQFSNEVSKFVQQALARTRQSSSTSAQHGLARNPALSLDPISATPAPSQRIRSAPMNRVQSAHLVSPSSPATFSLNSVLEAGNPPLSRPERPRPGDHGYLYKPDLLAAPATPRQGERRAGSARHSRAASARPDSQASRRIASASINRDGSATTHGRSHHHGSEALAQAPSPFSSSHNRARSAKSTNGHFEDVTSPEERHRAERLSSVITIHVIDSSHRRRRDFFCSYRPLVKKMGFFRNYLHSQDDARSVDISVHCDLTIFEWLLRYVKATWLKQLHETSESKLDAADREFLAVEDDADTALMPQLSVYNSASILISSDYLKMSSLVNETLTYDGCLCTVLVKRHALLTCRLTARLPYSFIYEHINDVIASPTSLSAIDPELIKQLSDMLTHDDLQAIKDPKDKLLSKLCWRKIELMLQPGQPVTQLFRCRACQRLLLPWAARESLCDHSRMRMDAQGRLRCHHERDTEWDLNEYLVELRIQGLSAKDVYWRLRCLSRAYHCRLCHMNFLPAEVDTCLYHSEPARFEPAPALPASAVAISPESLGAHAQGVFPCCGATVLRTFSSNFGLSSRRVMPCPRLPYSSTRLHMVNVFGIEESHMGVGSTAAVALEEFQEEDEDSEETPVAPRVVVRSSNTAAQTADVAHARLGDLAREVGQLISLLGRRMAGLERAVSCFGADESSKLNIQLLRHQDRGDMTALRAQLRAARRPQTLTPAPPRRTGNFIDPNDKSTKVFARMLQRIQRIEREAATPTAAHPQRAFSTAGRQNALKRFKL
ncbi:uncharacterized protein MONBRDRAFT_27699 [Monosiga brevicollis MX1]|uniref:SANT and BTB domain-containing protein n=1 Tax=Monosiga brevicollis TaxID=81824 RepID=A9V620_MONBE|nr:uncharacterized protein MONBRDRAFT_27699 [Monosiga brevicollis MX1]EDQ86998.1 predicted protein [Monosiga brevicollis MX1]|eukprot:XP_001748237.1 hypothetical protein [Monosiga brevicollis MX1]